MARIRTIKPEFWTSEQVAECSPRARLLFIGMWNFCDDNGRHPDSAMRLKMQVFPADALTAEDIELMLGELIDAGLIERYEAEGKEYIQVTGWHHQKIDNPSYRYPSPIPTGTLPEPYPKATPRNRKGRDVKTRSIGDDQLRELSEEEIGVVRVRANEVAKKVGKRAATAQDRSLVLKAAVLSLRPPFGESWLYGAAEGVAATKGTKRKPYAYLHKCLADGAAKFDRTLNSELAKVVIPHVLEKPPPNELTDERMCTPA